jgi:hypothetical protein
MSTNEEISEGIAPTPIATDNTDDTSDAITDAPDAKADSDTTEEEEIRTYSQKAKSAEDMGLTHWIMYSDGEAVYAYSLLYGNGVASSVLSSTKRVSSLAVDSNKGYLFVASTDSETTGHVDRYEFEVNTSKIIPTLSVNETSKAEIYQGKVI